MLHPSPPHPQRCPPKARGGRRRSAAPARAPSALSCGPHPCALPPLRGALPVLLRCLRPLAAAQLDPASLLADLKCQAALLVASRAHALVPPTSLLTAAPRGQPPQRYAATARCAQQRPAAAARERVTHSPPAPSDALLRARASSDRRDGLPHTRADLACLLHRRVVGRLGAAAAARQHEQRRRRPPRARAPRRRGRVPRQRIVRRSARNAGRRGRPARVLDQLGQQRAKRGHIVRLRTGVTGVCGRQRHDLQHSAAQGRSVETVQQCAASGTLQENTLLGAQVRSHPSIAGPRGGACTAFAPRQPMSLLSVA